MLRIHMSTTQSGLLMPLVFLSTGLSYPLALYSICTLLEDLLLEHLRPSRLYAASNVGVMVNK